MLPPFQTPEKMIFNKFTRYLWQIEFKRKNFSMRAPCFNAWFIFIFGNDLIIIGSRCKNYRASKMLIIFTFLDCGHFVSIISYFSLSFKTLRLPPKFRKPFLSTFPAVIKLNIPTITQDALEEYKFRTDERFTGHTSVLKTDVKKTKPFCK